MSRRASAKPAGVQMFPFLAVLICTMGALVVLLHAFARHGQVQAIEIAKAKAKTRSAEEQASVEDLQWRIGHLRTARAKTEAQLADERLKLAHVEDHQRRLREKLQQLQSAAEALENADESEQTRRLAAELEAAKSEVKKARQDLDATLAKGGHKRVNYSVVLYEGRHLTYRRPIYIECRDSRLILQPEGIELTPRDFGDFFGPGNPLAAAVRAQREYFNSKAPEQPPTDEPYPLFLVRPDGVKAYYVGRAALRSWGSDFGYELLGEDWDLTYREPDPELARLTEEVVAEARLRYRQYVASSPRVAKARSRPVYRARANGGFALVPGSDGRGPGGTSSGWDDDDPGPDPYGDDDRGQTQNTGRGNGDDPYGSGHGTLPKNSSGRGGNSRGWGDDDPGPDPYGSDDRAGTQNSGGGGGDDPYGSGHGAVTQNSAGRGDGSARYGGDDPYGSGHGAVTQNASGRGGTSDSGGRGSNSAQTGDAAGPNGPGGDASAASQSDGSSQSAGMAQPGKTPYLPGQPGTEQVPESTNSADGQRATGGHGGDATRDQAFTQGGQADRFGPPPEAGGNSRDPSAQAGAASGSPAHGQQSSSSSSSSDSCPAGQEPPQQASMSHHKPPSIASKRGENWGLPESGTNAVAATRPIVVQCTSDRLILLPETRGQAPRVIQLTERTEESMDELVSAIWDHMEGWGQAGRGLYWRPALSVDVKPGGADRYADIKALLADSGLDVHPRRATAANRPPARQSNRPQLRERRP